MDEFPIPRHTFCVQTKCAECDAAMHCNPEGNCWCMELPRIPMPAEGASCLCSQCLQKKLDAKGAVKSSNDASTPSANATG